MRTTVADFIADINIFDNVIMLDIDFLAGALMILMLFFSICFMLLLLISYFILLFYHYCHHFIDSKLHAMSCDLSILILHAHGVHAKMDALCSLLVFIFLMMTMMVMMITLGIDAIQ